MRISKLFLAATAALGLQLAGCGAPAGDEAAPSYDTVSMDMDSSDGAAAQDSQALGDNLCHPHLFQRTREVVKVLNHHIFKVMGKIDKIVDKHPDSANGNHYGWYKLQGDIELRATLDQNADGSYHFVAEAKAKGAADSEFVKIADATYTSASDGTPHSGTGDMTLDLTALSRISPKEKAEGQVAIHFDVHGATKTLRVQLTDFTPDADKDARPPRDANYVFERTKGKGGSLKFKEDVVLFCPKNPAELPAKVKTIARWANLDGRIVGRADSVATGGQITAGTQWLGLTCFSYAEGKADASGEGYWQMKSEDASGAVLQGDATFRAKAEGDVQASCDAAFGPVPAFDSNQGDFDFSAVNFDDASVVAYPGQTSSQQ